MNNLLNMNDYQLYLKAALLHFASTRAFARDARAFHTIRKYSEFY